MISVVLAAALALQLSSPMLVASATCGTPNEDVRVLVPAQPKLSDAQMKAVHGTETATVNVQVDAGGKVQSASIAHSSGSPVVDQAAVNAAKASSYAPATRNCKSVAGAYLFKVQVRP